MSKPDTQQDLGSHKNVLKSHYDSIAQLIHALPNGVHAKQIDAIKEHLDESIALQQTHHFYLTEEVYTFIGNWLEFKKHNGSAAEKAVYARMDEQQLIDRIFTKRPKYFYGANNYSDIADAHLAGTDADTLGENSEYILQNCISIDEGRIAAMIVPAGRGKAYCTGTLHPNSIHYSEGIDVFHSGCVGVRLEKAGEAEYPFVFNADQMEDGRIFSAIALREFWRNNFYTNCGNYQTIQEGITQQTFSPEAFKKRLCQTFEASIAASLDNALKDPAKKPIQLGITGLGLGNWGGSISETITPLFLEAYQESFLKIFNGLEEAQKTHLKTQIDAFYLPCFDGLDEIVVVGFRDTLGINCWNEPPRPQVIVEALDRSQKKLQEGPLKINDAFKGQDQEIVVHAMAPWDSMSSPGNELFNGLPQVSGDPAYAMASDWGMHHDPKLNPHLRAENAKIITSDGKLVDIANFIDSKKRTDAAPTTPLPPPLKATTLSTPPNPQYAEEKTPTTEENSPIPREDDLESVQSYSTQATFAENLPDIEADKKLINQLTVKIDVADDYENGMWTEQAENTDEKRRGNNFRIIAETSESNNCKTAKDRGEQIMADALIIVALGLGDKLGFTSTQDQLNNGKKALLEIIAFAKENGGVGNVKRRGVSTESIGKALEGMRNKDSNHQLRINGYELAKETSKDYQEFCKVFGVYSGRDNISNPFAGSRITYVTPKALNLFQEKVLTSSDVDSTLQDSFQRLEGFKTFANNALEKARNNLKNSSTHSHY